MTRVYLDPSALLLTAPAPSGAGDQLAPGAAEAVHHLVETGVEVVLLAPAGTLPELGDDIARAGALPEHLEATDWYLTGEPHPAFGRPRGGTTVLVGPHRPQGKVPLPRFDLEARDPAMAAMEILTRDAMA